MANERWYPNPSESGSHDAWNIHTQILNHVYATQDRLDALEKAQAKPSAAVPKSSSAATIAGINVKATTPPQNGFTIRFNSATGEFEFGV